MKKALPENIRLAVREIKSAIVRAQSRVAANANAEMLSLYFGIGQYVSHKTKTEKWGTGVIDAISHRLQQEMPGLRGFSGKSIRTMRQFYEKWAEVLFWPPAAAKLERGAQDGVICSPAVSKLALVGDRLVCPFARPAHFSPCAKSSSRFRFANAAASSNGTATASSVVSQVRIRRSPLARNVSSAGSSVRA